MTELTDRQKQIKQELQDLIEEYLNINNPDSPSIVTAWVATAIGVGEEINVTRGVNITSEDLNVYQAMGIVRSLVIDIDEWYTSDEEIT